MDIYVSIGKNFWQKPLPGPIATESAGATMASSQEKTRKENSTVLSFAQDEDGIVSILQVPQNGGHDILRDGKLLKNSDAYMDLLLQ